MRFRLVKGDWRGPTSKRRCRRMPRRMHPERYVESFFAKTAARINTALRLSDRHFEAAKLLHELRELMCDDSWRPRRA